MFRVGQKVVCVAWPADLITRAEANYAHVGSVYTIRAINVWPDSTKLRFYELDNSHMTARMGGKIEPGFNAKFFRPVVDRPTDISIFTRMLTDADEDARAMESAAE